MFLTFLVVSDLIWCLFVLLTAFAANSRLADYAVLFVSLHFPLKAGPIPHSAALFQHLIETAHKMLEFSPGP
jgi:hypothetical protein